MYVRTLAGYEKASMSHTIAALSVVRNLGVLYRDQASAPNSQSVVVEEALDYYCLST
jgi:hypothetical protein